MPRRFTFLLVRLAFVGWLFSWTGCVHDRPVASGHLLREGDILFQSLPHGLLVDAIEGCTHSPFSHCGIAHQTKQGWVVIEAIGPVKETPLAAWVAQGRESQYAIYRLREPFQPHVSAMIAAAQRYTGRPYDMRYELDDEKIYCSELVFKAFRSACGQELGRLQPLGDLDWKPHQTAIETIEGGPVPLTRLMITPRSLSEASQLELVAKNAR